MHDESNIYSRSLRRQYVRDLYARSECVRCGDKAAIFHHRNPGEKAFGIVEGWSRSAKALSAEIAKCDPLCLECHKEAHSELRLQTLRWSRHQYDV